MEHRNLRCGMVVCVIVGVLASVWLSLPVRAKEFSESHQEAAERLVRMSYGGKSIEDFIGEILQRNIQTTLLPAIQADLAKQNAKFKCEDDLARNYQAFIQDLVSSSKLEAQIIELYARHFTEEELKQTMAFYQTPVGKKTIKLMPSLMQESMQMSQKAVKSKQFELQKMVHETLGKKGCLVKQ